MGSRNKRTGKPNEIYISRIFDAPVNIVWNAWTDPEQVVKWWGPRGFTITTNSMDVRSGGIWDYIMHGPDGVDYPNKTKFLEVQQFSHIIYDHGGNDEKPPVFRVSVYFSEVAGKTHMEMSMALPSAEAAAEARKFIRKAGGDTTWDRLAEYVSPTDRFVINRSFDAPIELMFDMWTDPAHISQWAPPTGFSMEFIRVDVKPGGGGFYCMSNSQGMKMYGKTSYKEIRKPDRVVYTQVFCDEQENISRHPFAPTWPETMLTTVTLTAEGRDRTRVTIVWEVYGEASAAERETFTNAKGGMTQGWTGSLDKLEARLETRQPAD